MPSIREYTAVDEAAAYSDDGWHGFVLDRRQGCFNDLSKWLESCEEVVLNAPCRRVSRHKTKFGTLYSKLMWARNDGAIQKRELISWFKWAYGPARSVHIWKISRKMMAAGHPCAVPVLAVRKKVPGGRHLNLLVTEEILAPTVEKIILEGGENAEKAVKAAGVCLAKLHKDNFVHGDYLPRNACILDDRIIFLDNDKTSGWSFRPPFFLRKRNVDQFAYSLLVLSGMDECRETLSLAFINEYCSEAGIEPAALIGPVMKKARARWERRKNAGRKK